MLRGGSTYYMMYDQVGSLRLVVDSSGNITKRVDYDSFGNIINDTDPGFAIPFGFAGGLHDRDTGLVRFGARDFDPGIGRWTAKDPIDFAGEDINLYGYVQNDPVNFSDPSGLINPIRNPNFENPKLEDLSFLVPSHALLDATSKSSSIAAAYSFVSGYGLPASIIFGSISIVTKSLDVAFYSNNSFVDSAAAIGGQFIPAPYDLLAVPFIDLATDYGRGLIGRPSNNTECP